MKDKAARIFEFLSESEHRKYPLALQRGYRHRNLSIFKTPEEKAYSLLHDIYFTQSQAKLNLAKVFFQDISNNPENLKSFSAFCKYLGYDEPSYDNVFNGLKKKRNGWGEKTSALFAKTLFQIHRHFPELIFWKDEEILGSFTTAKLHLPVDAVIKKIFLEIEGIESFKKINEFLASRYTTGEQFEIWDDLWFWGFITQKSKNEKQGEQKEKTRVFVKFNKGKYWSQLFTAKDKKTINEVKNLCKVFVEILKT